MTRSKPDVFNANCDSRRVLALIADRWSMLVIYALSERKRRHGELKRMIGGISQKMLTQTLLQPLQSICRWAQNHLPQVRAAREARPPH